ncbi:MAG: hypothetical protein H0V17_01060 [Deltaproteobacteria bacterium]|nr:hypothetical protein [Deltaproteobacteria bacterium]
MAIVALLATLAACAPMPKHPIAVAVIVEGERDSALPEASVAGLALHPISLAPEPAATNDGAAAALAKARSAYATGNHDACRTEIAKLDVPQLLAAGNRAAAARALALDTACAYQGLAQDDAVRAAARLAAFALDLPADAVAREAEELIIAAIGKASAAARARLQVTGELGARVAVDGNPAMCVVPCPLDLAPGDHVIAVEADAFEPAWKLVRVPDVATVAMAQQKATAVRASSQWRARIGRGLPATDDTGATLLALAAREPRIAYLHAGRGTLIVDGKLRASGSDTDAPRLMRELAYDGGLLQRPKVWQRPWFWIAVTGITAVAAGAVIYVTYEPEIQTMVTF